MFHPPLHILGGGSNTADEMAGALNDGDKEAVLGLIFEDVTSMKWLHVLRAALERAVAQGNSDVARRLLAAGVQPRMTALHAAITRRDQEMVIDLLTSGASVHGQDNMGRTPLHLAANLGETATVWLLVRRGAKKEVLDNDGRSPLFLATWEGRLDAAVALMAAGANINNALRRQDNRPVLHIAVERQRYDVMRAAIGFKAKVNVRDALRNTPLHLAAAKNDARAIHVLVDGYASTEARNLSGCTPIHQAASTLGMDALVALVERGANVDAQDIDLRTPLFKASFFAGRQGEAEMVDLLLRSGADETIPDVEGSVAADVVGEGLLGHFVPGPQIENAERVRQLLATAPVDKMWYRRGYLVMCRQFRGRIRPGRSSLCACRRAAGCRRAVGCRCAVGCMCAAACGRCVVWTVSVEEGGIFRKIVGYL